MTGCISKPTSDPEALGWISTKDTGKADIERLLRDAHVVVNNHRASSWRSSASIHRELAGTHPGLVHVSVTCYGSTGPWAHRGGFDMNGSAASGLMVLEGSQDSLQLPATGLINDFITGYMGALGAAAGLIKQHTEGGSWHVTVNLTRTAMWYQSLGLVDPADVGCDDQPHHRRTCRCTTLRAQWAASSTLAPASAISAAPRLAGRTRSWYPEAQAVPNGRITAGAAGFHVTESEAQASSVGAPEARVGSHIVVVTDGVDELDVALLDALHLNPQATL